MEHKLYHCFIPDGDSLRMKTIISDTIHNVHKFNDPKLLRNPTTSVLKIKNVLVPVN